MASSDGCLRIPTELIQLKYENLDIKLESSSILGSGCFSTVYRARCDQLPCAAKYLSYPKDCVTREEVIRLQMACQLLCVLRHPNLVQCLGSVRHGYEDNPIILLELMDENLTQLLQRSRQRFSGIPYHVKVNICHDVILGLLYLHHNGIVHANLSSNNVLIVGESRAKLSDFWTLAFAREAPHVNFIQGLKDGCKEIYMAPEVVQDLQSKTFSRQSDTYSFGVLSLQIETMSPLSPNNVLGAAVLQCKQMPTSSSVFFTLAHRCLMDDHSQRPELKTLCQDLFAMKERTDYTMSLRGEHDGFRYRLMELEKELISKEEEIDRLMKLNKEHELLELRLYSMTRENPSSHLMTSAYAQLQDLDEPDSATDGFGDNTTFQTSYDSLGQRLDVIIPVQEIAVSDVVLGEEDTGEVYLATWKDKQVAYKKLKVKRVSDEWVAKLEYEMKALLQLHHPRVVRVLGAALEPMDGQVAIILELTVCSLHHAIFVENRKFPRAKRMKIVRQVAEGLEFLHSRDVVHCSLTTETILLDEHDGAKIGNVGPKFLRSEFESIYDPVGRVSPESYFAALEIRHKRPLEKSELKKADVYSLAVICYIVMESKLPQRDPALQLLDLHHTPDNLSSEMLQLVRQCLDQDATKRPTSGEFLKEWRNIM